MVGLWAVTATKKSFGSTVRTDGSSVTQLQYDMTTMISLQILQKVMVMD